MADPNPGHPAKLPDSIPDLPDAPEPPARRGPGRPPGRAGRPPSPENTRLGRVIQVRIDRLLQDAIADYMKKNDMTVSQALRVLITQGLDQERVNPDAVFHAAAFREGVLQGLGTVREKIGVAVEQALREITGEIDDGS